MNKTKLYALRKKRNRWLKELEGFEAELAEKLEGVKKHGHWPGPGTVEYPQERIKTLKAQLADLDKLDLRTDEEKRGLERKDYTRKKDAAERGVTAADMRNTRRRRAYRQRRDAEYEAKHGSGSFADFRDEMIAADRKFQSLLKGTEWGDQKTVTEHYEEVTLPAIRARYQDFVVAGEGDIDFGHFPHLTNQRDWDSIDPDDWRETKAFEMREHQRDGGLIAAARKAIAAKDAARRKRDGLPPVEPDTGRDTSRRPIDWTKEDQEAHMARLEATQKWAEGMHEAALKRVKEGKKRRS